MQQLDMPLSFDWRIQPSGDAALNLLGLSTQVPGRWIYLSDGSGREYEIGNHSLVFKKSALKDVSFKYSESGLMVQAMKALDRKHVDQKVVEHICQQLKSKACDRILKDTRRNGVGGDYMALFLPLFLLFS